MMRLVDENSKLIGLFRVGVSRAIQGVDPNSDPTSNLGLESQETGESSESSRFTFLLT